MIELKDLAVGYRGKAVLGNVNLTFPDASITVLLGPNGCGKSTLCETLLGQLPLISGRILLNGADAFQYSATERAQHLAYLPQVPTVPNLSAQRMVLHGRFPYLGFPRKYRKEDFSLVNEALQAVNAAELSGCQMPELSGGERQRVRFAMLLAQAADHVLMDEPTNFLDMRYQLEFSRLARQLADQGKAVILVLHDIRLAMQLADQIALFGDHKLLMCGSPEEVYTSGRIDSVFGVSLARVFADGCWQYYFRSQQE
ncbi:MAG: ABC transporter ATP-binding protein [Oscillospiraceae bacterium]|nr:ABC transporter ATP-binding protein [Oscillospiraceae bacterium]